MSPSFDFLSFQSKSSKWMVTAYMVIVIFFLGGEFFFEEELDKFGILPKSKQEKNEEKIIDIETRINEITKDIKTTKDQLNISELIAYEEKARTLIESLSTVNLKDPVAITSQISKLENRLSTSESEINTLQGALNPTAPTQILTLARLVDKVQILEEKLLLVSTDFNNLESTLEKKVDTNLEKVGKEIDRIIGVFQWLALLLIPIILNTFRDIFRPRIANETPKA